MKEANFIYKEYNFQKKYRSFIEKAWEFRVENDIPEKPWRFLPDYLPSIVIKSISGEKSYLLKGPHTKRVSFPSLEGTVVRCLRIYPFVVSSMFELNCIDIKNKIIPIDTLPYIKIDPMKYFSTNSKFDNEIGEFGSAILSAVINPGDHLIHKAVKDFIRSKGNIDYALYIEGCGIGRRQFQRRFKNETGLTARDFLRILKILKLTSDIVENDFYDRGLIYDYGYFDQPHFNRTFKEFFGITPYAFLERQKTVIYNKFTSK